MLSENYLFGLIDGEGSFFITIMKKKRVPWGNVPFQPIPSFCIDFKRTNETEELLNDVHTFLLRNNIRSKITESSYQVLLRVQKLNDCWKLAIFLEGKLRLKGRSLELWKESLKLIKAKEHLRTKGFLEIVRLRDEMGKYQKNKHKHDYDYYEKMIKTGWVTEWLESSI